MVNGFRHVLGSGEVGGVKIEHHDVAIVETVGHRALYRCAPRNATRAGNIDGNFRPVLALDAQSADQEVALRHRVDVAIRAFQWRQQQGATA